MWVILWRDRNHDMDDEEESGIGYGIHQLNDVKYDSDSWDSLK